MQTRYSRKYARFALGTTEGLGEFRAPSIINAAETTYETWTIAVPASPGSNTTYEILVDAATASTLTDASATQAELEVALLAALRQSGVYDIATPVLNVATHLITLSARKASTAIAVSVSGGAGATALTPTRTVQAAASSPIEPGLVMAAAASYTIDMGRLAAPGDVPIGVVMSTQAEEKDAIGPNARMAWKADGAVDVHAKSLSTDGIWTRCVEGLGGLLPSDPVYVVSSGANRGRVTKVSGGGNLAYPTAKFNSEVATDPNGDFGVLLYLN